MSQRRGTTGEDTPLATQLRQADAAELRRLVADHGHELTPRDVRQVLRNPFVHGEVIEDLLVLRQLLVHYEVRRAIALHPRSAASVAMRFLAGLYPRDLLELSLDMRLAPPARQAAESYLVRRLPRLTVGDRITLARRASPRVLAQLRHDENPSVIRALFQNSRLTEETLLPLVRQRSTPPRVLEMVARNQRWGRRYEIRLALAQHPLTPFRVALPLLSSLRRQDLRDLLRRRELSSVLHHRVREIIGESSASIDRKSR